MEFCKQVKCFNFRGSVMGHFWNILHRVYFYLSLKNKFSLLFYEEWILCK